MCTYNHPNNNMSYTTKQDKVSRMVSGFEAAKKTEYLKPTTIAGFIFNRLVSDFLVGAQTPIDTLVETHYKAAATFEDGTPEYRHGQDLRKSYTFSFERVGNYLRTINDTLESKGIEVVVNKTDDGLYASFYIS